jgi:Immunity protein 63
MVYQKDSKAMAKENLSYEDLLEQIQRLAKRIDMPASYLPNQLVVTDYLQIKKIDDHYTLTYSERGSVSSEHTFETSADLFYAYFKDATRMMAVDYEVRNRVEHQDIRRIQFTKWIELMSTLNSAWRSKLSQETQAMLKDRPYQDSSVWELLDKQHGQVYRNTLVVLQRFCETYKFGLWLPDIEQSLQEWESMHTTKYFVKASGKHVPRTRTRFFLNPDVKGVPELKIETQLLKLYLYWLQKGALAYAEQGQFEFPQYERDILHGYFCHTPRCNTAQVSEYNLNVYVATKTLPTLFKESLPHEEKLDACAIEIILQSESYAQTQRFIRLLTSEFVVLPNREKAERCSLCRKKMFAAKWEIIREGKNYFLSAISPQN